MSIRNPTVRCPLHHGELLLPGPPRAVFLDRDGVLMEDTGYPSDPDAVALLPGVAEALRTLRRAGWRLVVVTNQAGVARGRLTMDLLDQIHVRLRGLLEAEDVRLDGLFFCPHHPDYPVAQSGVPCDHRKPAAGMLLSAALRLRIDLSASWMVGDKESDVLAGHAAGCRSIRIGSPAATGALASVPDLLNAAQTILARSPEPAGGEPGAR